MNTLIAMDHTGDSRHQFDPTNNIEVLEAQSRFHELSKAGYIAAKRTGSGRSKLIREFDPTVKETVLFPSLVGG
jgi:hypothetical protein